MSHRMVVAVLAILTSNAPAVAVEPPAVAPTSTPVNQPALPDIIAMDSPAEMSKLIESYQSPAAREPGAADGWDEFIEVCARVHAIRGDTTKLGERAVPDFTSLIDPDANQPQPGFSNEEIRASTRKAIEALKAADIDAVFTRLRKAVHFARPRIGSDAYQASIARFGVHEVWTGPLLSMCMPEISAARHVARLECVRAADAAKAAQWGEFVVHVENALALARACAHQPTVIDRLVAHAILAYLCNTINRALTTYRPDDATLAVLCAALDRYLADLPPMDLAMGGERLWRLDAIRYKYDPQRAEFPGVFAEKSRARDVQLSEELDQLWGAYLRMPVWARATVTPPEDAILDKSPEASVLHTLIPAVSRAVQSEDQVMLVARGTRTALALERFERANQRLPASLDELAKSGLCELPIDQYSGRPLCYRPMRILDGRGRRYLLYSTGFDRVDDGGVEYFNASNPNDRFLALVRKGEGYDFVINED